MSEPTNNQNADLSSLQAKIGSLEATAQETVTRLRKRSTINMVIMAVVLVATAIYLAVAYSRFSTIDPELAAGFARGKIEESLPEVSQQLRKELKANAPGVIAMGEARLRQLPAIATQEIRTQTEAALDKHLPEIEEQVSAQLKNEIRKGLSANKKETNPEKRFQLILAEIEKVTAQHIDQSHQKYLDQSREVMDYLELLAENKNLTPRQQLQREMLRSFFELMHQKSQQQ